MISSVQILTSITPGTMTMRIENESAKHNAE